MSRYGNSREAWDEHACMRRLPVLQVALIEAIRRPAAVLTIPITAEEGLLSVHGVLTPCRAAATDVFSLKIHKLGAPAEADAGGAAVHARGTKLTGQTCYAIEEIEESVLPAARDNAAEISKRLGRASSGGASRVGNKRKTRPGKRRPAAAQDRCTAAKRTCGAGRSTFSSATEGGSPRNSAAIRAWSRSS
jgi:hypothetical protein